MGGTILNFGPLEIFFIAVLTLIIFGPERLPGIFRSFGRGIRSFREYYVRLAEQVRRELEPVHEDLGEIRQVVHDVRQDLSEIRGAVDLRAMLPSFDGPAPGAPTPDAAVTADMPDASSTQLAPDNPWTGVAAPPTTARLAEDNPWAG